jgi:hypothetical protein
MSNFCPNSSQTVTEGVLSFRDLPSLTLKAGPQIYALQVQIFIVTSTILHS